MTDSMQNMIFSFLSFVPGPLWLTLIFAPRNKFMMRCFDGFIFIASVIFAILVIPGLKETLPIIASPTMGNIGAMLSTRTGTLASWNHFIIGDLWIGRWIAHDAVAGGVHGLLRAAFLMVTLFFGPLGLCLYLIYRMTFLKKFSLTYQK